MHSLRNSTGLPIALLVVGLAGAATAQAPADAIPPMPSAASAEPGAAPPIAPVPAAPAAGPPAPAAPSAAPAPARPVRPRAATARRAAAAAAAAAATAAPPTGPPTAPGERKLMLDFRNAEISAVIDTIAAQTGRNFIYDDRVRGQVTIISPEPMSPEQAFAVFESVLQVKGFTTVETPSGALKVIPTGEAKETNLETSASGQAPANRDTYVTRLIPLNYIEAGSIVETLKPLVSKSAAIAAYGPTNTVILTESASNIRRLIDIIESIDVETYREELAVLRIEHADAATLAEQLGVIFGERIAENTTTGGTTPTRVSALRSRRTQPGPSEASTTNVPAGQRGTVRIITDERTNALIVLAPRAQLEEVRRLVRQLDVPISGGGRIHVYYLQHADSEELAETLQAMLGGAPTQAASSGAAGPPGESGAVAALRSRVEGLAEGISVTADPATNALVIQASQEGFTTLSGVIELLDVARPQVLVEALIMEVDVSGGQDLGFSGLMRITSGDMEYAAAIGGDAAAASLLGPGADIDPSALSKLAQLPLELVPGVDRAPLLGGVSHEGPHSTLKGFIRALATDADTNVIAAPHILTLDNEEAEIRIGDEVPVPTSRVDAAVGGPNLSTSVNIERKDIGVNLKVTPQITEGDSLRLDIYQEITDVNLGLTAVAGVATEEAGLAFSKRTVDNTVTVRDGDTVVIGGLISSNYSDTVDKVPFLGDIPVLGWAFKTTSRTITKKNLLIFLTPYIVREDEELVSETIRKREQLLDEIQQEIDLGPETRQQMAAERAEAEAAGEVYQPPRGENPLRNQVLEHANRYPAEERDAIEADLAEERAAAAAAAVAPKPRYLLRAGPLADEQRAVAVVTALVDLGYESRLDTSDAGGTVVYELRVGPFDELPAAQEAAEVVERSQALRSEIVYLPPLEAAP